MCESCNEVRERCWDEIRDLLHYKRNVNGPLSTQMKENVATIRESSNPEIAKFSDEEIDFYVESLRCEMIAERCAIISARCPGTQFHHAPPSIVLGAWAANMLQTEILHTNPILGMLFGLESGLETGDDN